jgi:hypothetical protein
MRRLENRPASRPEARRSRRRRPQPSLPAPHRRGRIKPAFPKHPPPARRGQPPTPPRRAAIPPIGQATQRRTADGERGTADRERGTADERRRTLPLAIRAGSESPAKRNRLPRRRPTRLPHPWQPSGSKRQPRHPPPRRQARRKRGPAPVSPGARQAQRPARITAPPKRTVPRLAFRAWPPRPIRPLSLTQPARPPGLTR